MASEPAELSSLELAITALEGQLMADARYGAPWRGQLRVPEPGGALATALAAVADAVTSVDLTGAGPCDGAVLDLLDAGSADGDAPAALARAVLRSALEARRDVRAVGAP